MYMACSGTGTLSDCGSTSFLARTESKSHGTRVLRKNKEIPQKSEQFSGIFLNGFEILSDS